MRVFIFMQIPSIYCKVYLVTTYPHIGHYSIEILLRELDGKVGVYLAHL